MPVPVLVRPSGPPPLIRLPEKVVEVLRPPAVSVAVPVLLSTVPAPASEPIVLEKPFRSSVPATV